MYISMPFPHLDDNSVIAKAAVGDANEPNLGFEGHWANVVSRLFNTC